MAKKIRLDFSKVEERSGWNTKEMPEGVHEFKIVSCEVGEAKDGTEMLIYALQPTAPRFKTRLFPYYCKLQPNQLFKIRDLLVAAGITVPKKATSIDPDQPVGAIVAAEVSDEVGQYAGRSSIDGIYDRSIIDDSDQTDDQDEADDEDYEADEVDEVEDEDLEGDDELREEVEGLTLAALRKRAKELGIDTDGVKKDELVELVIEEELAEGDEEDEEDEEDFDDEEDLGDEDLEDEEFEDDEEDEEEEEPAPAPRRRAAPARKPAAKAAAPVRRAVKRR